MRPPVLRLGTEKWYIFTNVYTMAEARKKAKELRSHGASSPKANDGKYEVSIIGTNKSIAEPNQRPWKQTFSVIYQVKKKGPKP